MINHIENYEHAGFACGNAARVQDWSCATFQKRWYVAAIRLENAEDRDHARAAFDAAWKRGRRHNGRSI